MWTETFLTHPAEESVFYLHTFVPRQQDGRRIAASIIRKEKRRKKRRRRTLEHQNIRRGNLENSKL